MTNVRALTRADLKYHQVETAIAIAKLIIVANRLPVSLAAGPHGLQVKVSPGGMAAALSPVMDDPATCWVGYAGAALTLSRRQQLQLGMSKQLQPVSIPDDLYARYYLLVANGSLWPVCHGMRPRRIYNEEDWQAYVTVNAQFADKIASFAKPQDSIWIHDFHLFLLPNMLRERGLKNRIGHFLHVPVPGMKLLERLPHYRDILSGWSDADLCGVQTEQDARRLRSLLKTVNSGGKTARVQAFPVGIDYAKYASAHDLPAVRARVRTLTNRLAGQKVVCSVSRLDYTKGILEQLVAVEHVLASGQRVIYKLVVSPSREDVAGYWELKQEIDARVEQLNQRFGGSGQAKPIDYEYRNMDFEELVSWYCRADIMLVAPLVDGMNLVAKEYIAARPKDDGVLILSKTAGAASQLKAALLVDPNDVSDMSRVLEQAIAMPLAERRARSHALCQIIQTEDAHHWAKSFAATLAQSTER